MLFTIIVCTALTAWRLYFRQRFAEQWAVNELGGNLVQVNREFGSITYAAVFYCTPAMVSKLESMKSLQRLQLSYSTVTKEVATNITSIDTLVLVRLSNCTISSEALEILTEHTHILHLDLSDTPLPPNSANILAKARQLESLYVINCGLTDNELAYLRSRLRSTYILGH